MSRRLNVGAAAPLHVLAADPAAVARTAKQLDDIARRLLYTLSPDDPVHGFYSTCMFAVVLVDEKKLHDQTNMGVLAGLLAMDDLREEGGIEKYTFKEPLLRAEAYKLLAAARKEGLYGGPLVDASVVGGDPKATKSLQ